VPAEDVELHLDLYRRMLVIRRFEDLVQALFLRGEVYGTTHLYSGMEAVGVGFASALGPDDRVACTYRGHGHALALGLEPQRLLDELLGRASGVNGGRAGSMNVVDLDHGLVGCFGIVGGSIAAEYVFTSPPDGYTLLASQPSPITTNPLLYKSLNYDPAQLIPVAIMSHIPNVVLVRENFPAKTVAELIAYAKANPGKINYASQGIGTSSHTTAELFQKITQTKLVHVPYKGTAPALNDLLAGNVDLMFNELASSLALYKAGKARILAVTVAQRVPSLPDIPTLDEAGVHGCLSDTWHALTAPPKTPDDIIAKLNAVANQAMTDPDLLARFKDLSISPGGGSPAEAAAFIKSETQRWSEVIRDAGIQPQ